jgi:hypothetical protein
MQEECLSVIQGWMEDPFSNANPTACLIAGMIYANEGNRVEALKACHGPNSSLEMCVSESWPRAWSESKSVMNRTHFGWITYLCNIWRCQKHRIGTQI